jgi:competence protein ComEA
MRFRNAILAVALFWPVPLVAQTELPDGPGKQKVQKICGGCHEIETVVASRRTRVGWQHMTEDMVARGAEGSEEDMLAVVAYLAEWFGKVNVNTGSAAELQKTLGIGEKEARAIVSYREQNGEYKNFEELLKTPGADPEKLRQKRSLVAFSQ